MPDLLLTRPDRVDSTTGAGTEFAARVDPDEPLFAGHYPGFPIFPGVGLIELVRQAAVSAPPDGAAIGLRQVVSTRFSAPVYPSDDLTISLRWQPAVDGWRCTAKLRTSRGPAASIVLDLVAVAA